MGRTAAQEARYQELKRELGEPSTASVGPSGPAGVVPGAPQRPETSGMLDGIMPPAHMKDPNLETKADLFEAPELRKFSVGSLLSKLGTLGTNQDQTMDILKQNIPGLRIKKTGPKGTYLEIESEDGESYTWKPGLRGSDLLRAGTAMAMGAGGTALAGMAMPATLAAAVPTSLAGLTAGALGGLAGAAAVEVPKALAGGTVDPSSLVLSAGLGAIGPAVGEAAAFANARATAPAAPKAIGDLAAQAAREGVDSAAAQDLARLYGHKMPVVGNEGLNLETLRAARDLNVHVPADMLANLSPEAQHAVRYSQATKSAATNAGGTGLQQQNDEILEIAKRIRGIPEEFGAAPGTNRVNELVRDDRALEIAGLRSQEAAAYPAIRAATKGQEVPADLRIVKLIEDMGAEHRDGLAGLPKELQAIHAKLAPRARPTDPATGRIPAGPRYSRPMYGDLETERQAMGAKAAPNSDFPDQYRHRVADMHTALRTDEDVAATALGAGKERDAAHALTVARKGVEGTVRDLGYDVKGNLVNSNIPDLQGDIMPKLRGNFQKALKGDVGDYVQDMKNLPTARRHEATLNVLDDVFHGSAENPVTFTKFRETWGKAKKNQQTMSMLADNLPPGVLPKMDSAYRLAKDIGRLGSYQSKTGTTLNNSVAQGTAGSFLDAVLDFLPLGRAAGAMTGASVGNTLAGPRGSMAGAATGSTVGGGFSRMLKTLFQGAGDPGSVARDALLSSPEFRTLVLNVATQAPKAPSRSLISRMVTPVVTSKPFVAIIDHARVPGNDGRKVLEHAVKSAIAGTTVAEVNSPANRKKD